MNLDKLYKLSKKDLDKSAQVLAKAFYDYPMFKCILGEKHNMENIEIFLRFLIKYAVLYGKAYGSSSEIEGILLFSSFKDYHFNLFRSLRSGALSLVKLGSDAGKKLNEFNNFSLKIHQEKVIGPHQYVILLGVDPEKQGQGFGSKLMYPMLKTAEKKGQPCYLETHSFKNVKIYEGFGFELISEDLVPGINIPHWSMLKK
ncbi:GNAT family N-acetyltransferase [Iocasia frigidifontis]|uniref:GNAT family N-acetyltransferase n=1 Tax=Iocasia fonsfrigidae TaxID=2682810 RepID=A0A8A7KFC3_9FIRM|nr:MULTISPECIES: GNAT family N-acetyltransferase [Halanaerobiaceae]AZO95915.1 GNAT family N-acetyltransferase [Halocella sp. SP3-1]QTL98785.1 GNAT family N-acetyltransferase [Iocasia fonsfrigidae]